MDTLTHALSGVLLARAVRPAVDRPRLLVVALAATFPDLDYLLFWLDPDDFLYLHRGPTHSLVLLPLWAGSLALPLGRVAGIAWREAAGFCAIGLLAHVLGDWVTLYGTRLFYPLIDQAYALRLSFDVNPWIALIVVVGVLRGDRWRPRRSALITLALVTLTLAGQGLLGARATAVAAVQARAQGLDPAAVRAIPQPLSPFHWALLLERNDGHAMAYLDLLGPGSWAARGETWLGRMLAGYHGRGDLVWDRFSRPDRDPLTASAWQHPGLAGFRRFAEVPALWGIEQRQATTCVWFTDLRHRLPALPAPFRYGLCRTSGQDDWQAFRLRYADDGEKEAL